MIRIIFFGGYGASEAQVEKWADSAKKLRPEHDFVGIPYYSKSADDVDAVKDSKHTLAHYSALINDNLSDHYLIVGHSSGCAVANELARETTKNKNVKLIVLDGFIPSKDLQEKVHAECWYGWNPDIKMMSLNGASMKHLGVNVKVHNSQARTVWGLHFSLVNTNVPIELGRSTFVSHGYDNCSAMLDYLPHAGPVANIEVPIS